MRKVIPYTTWLRVVPAPNLSGSMKIRNVVASGPSDFGEPGHTIRDLRTAGMSQSSPFHSLQTLLIYGQEVSLESHNARP